MDIRRQAVEKIIDGWFGFQYSHFLKARHADLWPLGKSSGAGPSEESSSWMHQIVSVTQGSALKENFPAVTTTTPDEYESYDIRLVLTHPTRQQPIAPAPRMHHHFRVNLKVGYGKSNEKQSDNWEIASLAIQIEPFSMPFRSCMVQRDGRWEVAGSSEMNLFSWIAQ